MNQNLIKISLAILAVVLFTVLFSCTDNAVNDDSDLSFPEEGEVKFFKHVQPFVRVRCASAACHDDYDPAAGRRMTDYFTYFGTKNLGFVIPENPGASLLNQIAEGKNKHLFQLGLALPTENQQEGLRRWVEAGALLN